MAVARQNLPVSELDNGKFSESQFNCHDPGVFTPHELNQASVRFTDLLTRELEKINKFVDLHVGNILMLRKYMRFLWTFRFSWRLLMVSSWLANLPLILAVLFYPLDAAPA